MLTFGGGIPFNHSNKTKLLPIQKMEPEYIHLEIPKDYDPIVSLSDNVKIGQIIASHENESFSPVCSGISGIVESVDENKVVIKNDYKNYIYPGLSPVDFPLTSLETNEIISILQYMGIYDGGTPLSEKIKKASGKIENIIVSCTASEPPSVISQRITDEYKKELIGGLKILIHATKARMGIIAIGDEEFCLNALEKEINDPKLITIRFVENKYPIENEKCLLNALTRKEYQNENIIENSRCLILNVESVVNAYLSFTTGIPIARKFLSVSGGLKEAKNLSVPIGTKISEILDFCGGTTRKDPQIIEGGFMSGQVITDEDTVSYKTSCITSTEKSDVQLKGGECIRCGKCIHVCPMLLKPLYLYSNILYERPEKNLDLGIKHCISCGCCSYFCPAALPLSQTILDSVKSTV